VWDGLQQVIQPFLPGDAPDEQQKGRSGSMPNWARVSGSSIDWYSSMSMPLGMTTTRVGSTSNRRRMSSRVLRETAMMASAISSAVFSIQRDRS
jgi:hypothetical protein